MLEEFDNISVTRSNSLRKESPPTPHLGHANHVQSHQQENGYITYSQYSSESEAAADFVTEKYRGPGVPGEELDRYSRGSYAAKQNGAVVKMKPGDMYFAEAQPLRSDLSRFLSDYPAHLDARSKPSDYGGLRLEYQRVTSGSPLEYKEPFHYTPSRTSTHSHSSRERLEYSESDWGKDDYDQRPKSSYVNPASPQPVMRQRSRSGSGLQEPILPYGASAFKPGQQGHSYSSYTYPRLSETGTGIPKVNVYRSTFSTLWSVHYLEFKTCFAVHYSPGIAGLK